MMVDVPSAGPIVAKRRAPRWLWLVLVLSLAANLLFIGIVGGSLWAVRRGGFWDAPLFLERSHRFMSGLPREQRQAIRAIFAEHRPRLQPYWREVRGARLRLGTLIERGGFSREEFEAALQDLFAKEGRAREAAKPMVTAMVVALRPEERVHFLRVYMPYLYELQGRPEQRGAP